MKPEEVQLFSVYKEGLSSKPKFIPYGELPQLDFNKDHYISLFQYTKEQKELAEAKGTLAGIRDTTTSTLYFDFDSKDNLELARKDAVQLAKRLVERGVDPDDIHAAFTGSKGFSVEIKLNKRITNEQFKAAVQRLAGDLKTFDHVVSDPNRIVRIDGTKHNKTDYYKTPFHIADLDDYDSETLIKACKDQNTYTPKFKPVNLTDDVFMVTKKKEKPVFTSDLEEALERLPKGWKNYKWALASGFFEPGERHNALMVIAATCRGLGYDKDTAYYICKSAIKKQSSRTESDEFPKEELYENIIDKSVYSDTWEGGQYSPDTNPWLKKYCERMGFEVKREEESKVRRIQDIQDEFKHFVDHIEENTILTGIPSLDKALPITIGMNLGIVGAASSGKCLGKDTPIRMYDGSIKMVQDIKSGELIMGDDSTPRTVLSICRGKEKLYKVMQDNGDDYIVNASHVLSLKTNENKGYYQKGQIIDINIEDFINKSDNFKDRFSGYKVRVEYPEQKLSVNPYYLGLWLGDGSSRGTYLYTKDQEIVDFNEEEAELLGLTHKVYFDKRNEVQTVKITGDGKKDNTLRQELVKLGVLRTEQKLDNHKHIPKNYLINSRENRLKLLAGLMDSDGHARNDLTNYTITQVNKELSYNILELVRSLGYKASITEVTKYASNTEAKNKGIYYTIYFSGTEYEDLTRFMRINRKKCEKGISRSSECTRIRFEDLGEGDYYGFEIDGNHRFLLGDFTVTHNTAIALEILKNTSKAGVISVFASLDMHRNRLFEKLLYKTTGLSRGDLYAKIQGGEIEEITKKIKEDYANVWFYDRSCPTVSDIREYIDEVEAETGKKVKLVMLDYFERVNSEKSEDTAASKDIAGQLQDLVNDYNVAMVTLVQPNKFSLSSGPDKPIRSYTAIKGSSFLYQSFRSIISIWRPFFTPETVDKDKFLQMAILKNDLGELGLFNFAWSGKRGDIREITEEEDAELQYLLEQKKAAEANTKSDGGWE